MTDRCSTLPIIGGKAATFTTAGWRRRGLGDTIHGDGLRRLGMTRTYPVDDRTQLLDLLFLGRPQIIGAYLLLGDPPALVETGPSPCLPALDQGLAGFGLRVEDLGAVVVTHVHLDHAGAAGVLARRNPDLAVYVHQVGAPHLADPSRLLRSAARIYGDMMGALWGEVAPVPAERIVALADGDAVPVGGRVLRAIHSPGHAYHHHAFLDESSGTVFTGDAAGVALPGCGYVRPPTPPPDLDLEAWDRTLDRLEGLDAPRLCLTHFGVRDDPPAVLAQLRRRLPEYAEVLRPGVAAGEDLDGLVRRLRLRVEPEIREACGEATLERYEIGAGTRMNVQGYLRYFEVSSRAG